jgi:hypothetical protein
VRFPFRPCDVVPSAAHPFPTIWRPIVPIRVSGPAGTSKLFGLLDTGADETTIPMNVAALLGLELDPREPARFLGTGGQQAKGFYGKDVGFEFRQGKKSYRWVIPKVACLYDPPEAIGEETITLTLGQIGFLRYFNVTFDNQRARVEIRPNGLFPQRQT